MSDKAILLGRSSLSLTVDAPTLLGSELVEAIRALLGLANAVGDSVAPGLRLQWQVRHISMASPLAFELEPVARQNVGDVVSLGSVSRQIIEGVEAIQSGGARPEFISDNALTDARTLGRFLRKRGRHVALGAAGRELEVTRDLERRVDELLEPAYHEDGSVEGYLEAINIHGSERYFAIYDDFTGDRIQCTFGRRVKLTDITAYLERRVSVEGEISYRRSGEIAGMAANALSVFPEDKDLPTAEDVLGILRPS